ncbi:MAG TPA: glycosyltransferase family 9 protein [Candidatus Acidoferrales bacterium]
MTKLASTPSNPLHSAPAQLLPALPENSEILIVRPRSLGDLVLETPAIAALKAWRPDLRISVLVEPRFAAALEGNPAIHELILSKGLAATALDLRRRKFPVVFNQHGGPRSAILTGISGAPCRVGWKDFQYSFFYNVPVPDALEFYSRPDVHTIEHRLSQFYWTGLPRGPIPPTQVFVGDDARISLRQKLAAQRITIPKSYAVLQPGARSAGMRWPTSKFAELTSWLHDTCGITSVVNCGPQDGDVAREVRDQMRGAAIPENLNLRELIALIAGAQIFVGNDSGPAHVAAALERPTVVIFSQTDPAQWGPKQSQSRIVSTGAKFKHPRGDKAVVVAQPRSIGDIAVDEIRQACSQLLG